MNNFIYEIIERFYTNKIKFNMLICKFVMGNFMVLYFFTQFCRRQKKANLLFDLKNYANCIIHREFKFARAFYYFAQKESLSGSASQPRRWSLVGKVKKNKTDTVNYAQFAKKFNMDCIIKLRSEVDLIVSNGNPNRTVLYSPS